MQIVEVTFTAETGVGSKENCTKEDLLAMLEALEGLPLAVHIEVLEAVEA